jgi:hypothetical protein
MRRPMRAGVAQRGKRRACAWRRGVGSGRVGCLANREGARSSVVCVLRRSFPQAERDLHALGRDPQRDDVAAALQIDDVDHQHRRRTLARIARQAAAAPWGFEAAATCLQRLPASETPYGGSRSSARATRHRPVARPEAGDMTHTDASSTLRLGHIREFRPIQT